MTKRTVYVVGAGASHEIGLPTGEKLKTQIAELLDMQFEFHSLKYGDYDIWQAIQRHHQENPHDTRLDEYRVQCQKISKSMPLSISIDNYIDCNRGNKILELCGKLAIIKSILQAERDSKLYIDPGNAYNTLQYSNLAGSWYLPFFRTLTENCDLGDIGERLEKITLIIFNYDRCIEFFLINAFSTYYGLNGSAASELVQKIKILHPYGTVGSLPSLAAHGECEAGFGGDVNWTNLLRQSYEIRTFTEGAESTAYDELGGAMASAERLIFMGFAFHPLNMEILSGGVNGYENIKLNSCFATAYGMSNSDQGLVVSSVQSLYRHAPDVFIGNLTCSDFFQHYSRSLGYTPTIEM